MNKKMTTLEIHEEMYRKALEDDKWRNGATLEEMLNNVNSSWG